MAKEKPVTAQCPKIATHGTYCLHHARILTGRHRPDPNPEPSSLTTCAAVTRHCPRTATHGAYCYQHAKVLTGFYEPDQNRPNSCQKPNRCAEVTTLKSPRTKRRQTTTTT